MSATLARSYLSGLFDIAKHIWYVAEQPVYRLGIIRYTRYRFGKSKAP